MAVEKWIWVGGLVAAAGTFIGAAAGAWTMRRRLLRQHAAAVRRSADLARRESADTLEKMRAAYTTLRIDQAHQRAALPRRLAAAVTEQKASVRRLEDELRLARIDLARQHAASFRATEFLPADDEPDHGFAPTQPFDDPD